MSIIPNLQCSECDKILKYSTLANYNAAKKRETTKCNSCARRKKIKTNVNLDEKKVSNNHYWTQIQEEAILRFIKATDQIEKDNIYNEFLREPLKKMVSSVYHLNVTRCLSFVNYYGSAEAGIHEGYCKLLDILDTFNPNKGRFYSYATFCLNRHFKLINSQLKNKEEMYEPLVNLTSQGVEEDNDTRIELSTHDKLHSNIDFKEYLGFLIKYLELQGGKLCRSKIQKHGLQVFIQSLKNPDLVGENKGEFFKVAKRENVAPYQFTHVLRKCRKVHKVLFAEYKRTGTVNVHSSYKLIPKV